MQKVKVIGGGLAGAECAFYLAERGILVELYDIKPNKFTPAHISENYAELVCSNSLKSNDIYGNAAGLLKEEMRILGSLIIDAADKTRVPAGNALAVNREEFSQYITDKIKNHKNITCITKEVDDIDFDQITVIATGPLTTDKLAESIEKIVDEKLYFFDASAPLVAFDSIDMDNAFIADRYGKGDGDHINCPMEKDEYQTFIKELLGAKRANLHEFESAEVFEGCMPVEIMASRGEDTLRYGPLKPVGLRNPKTDKRPYACLQLRKEDKVGTAYNLVGFQTNLTFAEQKRVFGLIPALKNAEFLRYGVMHRNTYINSPKVLGSDFSLNQNGNIYFAGQITGVEGYVESAAVGLMCAIHIAQKLNDRQKILFPVETVLGALSQYVSRENENFQPMNANFGILPIVTGIRDKAERKKAQAEKSLVKIRELKEILV